MSVEIGVVRELVIQQVGNKSREEGIAFASRTSDVGDSASFLRELICNSFKTEDYKHFDYVGGKDLNPIYRFVSHIFKDSGCIVPESNNIARILYEQSIHPNIKNGELYIVLLKDCVLNGCQTEAIAIIKSEKKDRFLSVVNDGKSIGVKPYSGLNLKMIDKGCLIFNLSYEEGYKVISVDRTNGSTDAHYWTDSFLHIVNCNDNFHQTILVADMYKDFVQQVVCDGDNVSGARIAKSISQLLSKESPVNLDSLTDDLGISDEQKLQFLRIKDQYESKFGSLPADFIPDSKAMKRRQVSKMNNLRLGDDFEIKILNPDANIEHGFDDKISKHYIKLWY